MKLAEIRWSTLLTLLAACGPSPQQQQPIPFRAQLEAPSPLIAAVGVAGPRGVESVLFLPMRSRVPSADGARALGRAVPVAQLEAYLRELPQGTRVIPVPAYEFTGDGLVDLDNDTLRRLNALDDDTSDDRIGTTARGLAAFDWGSGATSKGNCYRYAVNDPIKPGEPHSPFPGGTDPRRRITCDDIMNGARADGAVNPNADGSCPVGRYKICAAIQDTSTPGPDNDYHWWRQEADGSWTNKPGHGPVAPSGDPSAPGNRGTYDRFCGCLCVPLGPVFIDLDKPKADGGVADGGTTSVTDASTVPPSPTPSPTSSPVPKDDVEAGPTEVGDHGPN